MTPWTHLATAQIPGGGELRLMQRGQDFTIMSGRIELMSSRLYGSEVALADLALARVTDAIRPLRVLIGGLGMGFTLRAALKALPAEAKVTVAELVPEVVAWARGQLAHLHGGSLDDPRVILRQGDVADLLAQSAPGAFDVILMDTDNGPDGLNRDANDGLYSPQGLAALKRAVRRGGVVAVWSAAPDAAFAARFRRAGFSVDERRVGASPSGKGPRHIIWLGVAR